MINIIQNEIYIKRKIIMRVLRCEFHVNMKISNQLAAVDSAAVNVDVTDCIHCVDEQR